MFGWFWGKAQYNAKAPRWLFRPRACGLMGPPTMTRFSTLLILPALCLGTLWSGEARGGCEKDVECKGNRICEDGKCVAPGGGGPGVEPGTWTSPSGMPPPPEAPPLCTMDTDCKGERVCVEGECKASDKPADGGKKGAGPARLPTIPSVKARFTPEELDALRLYGCIDATSARMADRLVDRGFSSADFVAACKEDRSLRASHPSMAEYPSGTLETLAAAGKLGLGRSRRLELVRLRHGQGRALTDAYNRVTIGGHVQEAVGWTLTGAGAAAMLVGLILIPVTADHVVDESSGVALDEDGYGVGSIIMLVTGGVLLMAGVPTLALGRQKQKRWLAPGALEGGDAASLRKQGKQAEGAQLIITPTLGRGSAGLGVVGVF